jgi:hypothetical protein
MGHYSDKIFNFIFNFPKNYYNNYKVYSLAKLLNVQKNYNFNSKNNDMFELVHSDVW